MDKKEIELLDLKKLLTEYNELSKDTFNTISNDITDSVRRDITLDINDDNKDIKDVLIEMKETINVLNDKNQEKKDEIIKLV